jgi:hypothetical protein
MRMYILFLLILFLSACTNPIAEKEEAFIRLRLSKHDEASLEFIKDSINKRNEIWDSVYFPGRNRDEVEVITDSIVGTIYGHTRNPYSPALDHHLTYSKFMDWCHQNFLDPVKVAGHLKIKNGVR